MTADIDTLFSVLNTDMTSSAKLVYIALVYHANKNTLVAWPSRELLAKETSLDVKTVTRATNALVKNGFISKKKGQGGTKYSFEGALCPSPKGIKSFSKGHKVLSEGANTPTNIRKNNIQEHTRT